jgi:hypothetical protein
MIVVLPALSKPRTKRRIYFSFSLALFTIDMKPISEKNEEGDLSLNYVMKVWKYLKPESAQRYRIYS